jgi:hypothetical protein
MNMYNMEISIGSYKCRLELCLLIVVLFWVMFGHVMCSCCTISMREGLEMIKKTVDVKKMPNIKKMNDTITTTTTTREGFVNANNKAYGPEFSASKSAGYIMRPDTWAMPTLSYSKGTVPSAGAQDILNRNNPPLAPGEMDLFANTPFKPECCPNSFSSSEGCACLDMQQYGALVNRGGNNVPYSVY